MSQADKSNDFQDLQSAYWSNLKIDVTQLKKTAKIKKLIAKKHMSYTYFIETLGISELIWDEWMRAQRQIPLDYLNMILRMIDPAKHKGVDPNDFKTRS